MPAGPGARARPTLGRWPSRRRSRRSAPPAAGRRRSRTARALRRAAGVLRAGVRALDPGLPRVPACWASARPGRWPRSPPALVPCGLLAARDEAGGAPRRRGRALPGAPAPPARRARAHLRGLRLAVAAAAGLAFAGLPWPVVWAPWPVAAAAVRAGGGARPPLVPGGRCAPARRRRARLGGGDGRARAVARQAQRRRRVLPAPGGVDRRARALPARRHAALPRRAAGRVLAAAAVVRGAAGRRSPAPRASTAPALAHLVAAPLACALAVLALWRLLRAWEVRLVAPALSVALVFLLFAVEPADRPRRGPRPPAGRLLRRARLAGQGDPRRACSCRCCSRCCTSTRRGRGAAALVLLAAAGVAAVGLSTTATFLVPVIALACLAPLACAGAAARRGRRGGGVGLPGRGDGGGAALRRPPAGAVAAAGPRSRGARAAGGRHRRARVRRGDGRARRPARCSRRATPPRHGRRRAARRAARSRRACRRLVYELTGLGRPLWRLMWAMPVAALVGVARDPAGRGAPQRRRAAAPRRSRVGALVALAGTPVWQGRNTSSPAAPRSSAIPAPARGRLAARRAARAGDARAGARRGSASTLLMLDGRLTAVAPRIFYTRALPAVAARRSASSGCCCGRSRVTGSRPTSARTRVAAPCAASAWTSPACASAPPRSLRLLGARRVPAAACAAAASGAASVRDGAALDRPAGELGALAVLRQRRRCRSGRTARAGGS